jgi:hypothetical protein
MNYLVFILIIFFVVINNFIISIYHLFIFTLLFSFHAKNMNGRFLGHRFFCLILLVRLLLFWKVRGKLWWLCGCSFRTGSLLLFGLGIFVSFKESLIRIKPILFTIMNI